MNNHANTIFGSASTLTRITMIARLALAIAVVVPANMFDEMIYQRYMVPKDFGPSRFITHEIIALWRPIIAAVMFMIVQATSLACFLTPFYERRAKRQAEAFLEKKEKAEAEANALQRGNKLLQNSLRKFDELRNQVILTVLRYNEGQYIGTREREVLAAHRERLQELYPLLKGQEMFDEVTYRRMLTQIATFLEEEIPPGESSTPPSVTHH